MCVESSVVLRLLMSRSGSTDPIVPNSVVEIPMEMEEHGGGGRHTGIEIFFCAFLFCKNGNSIFEVYGRIRDNQGFFKT